MKNLHYFLIAGLIFIIIVLLMRDCSRPSEIKEAESKKQYETAIAILEADKNAIQAAQDSLEKEVVIRVRKDSVQLAAQNVRIKALQTKLANQRPTVIEKIQADTAVLSYVNTLEEIVTEQQTQIDTLKAQAEFQRQLYSGLITQELIEDKIANQMAIESQRRIAELEKSARKKERGKRLWKILAVIGTGIGFVAGASL